MQVKKLLLPAILAILMTSCTGEVISSSHKDVPEKGWSQHDTLLLALEVKDTTIAYDVAITLRHTDVYPYQNIWFFMDSFDGRRDTVLAILADDRGQWLTSRAGRYYTGYMVAERNVRFAKEGTYQVAIVHGMRDEMLRGVADVGVELRKTVAQEADQLDNK